MQISEGLQVHVCADVDFAATLVLGRDSRDKLDEIARSCVALRSCDSALSICSLRHEADDVEGFEMSDVGFAQDPIHVQTCLRGRRDQLRSAVHFPFSHLMLLFDLSQKDERSTHIVTHEQKVVDSRVLTIGRLEESLDKEKRGSLRELAVSQSVFHAQDKANSSRICCAFRGPVDEEVSRARQPWRKSEFAF